jgi:lysophospholipase L1-like esterase
VNTIDILQYANSWIKERSASIIHINSGLDDLKCIPLSNRENLIPLKLYAENIERIIKYIHRVKPETIMIWATTTPVIDERIIRANQETEGSMLYQEDVIRYNEALMETCQKLGIPVNDLFKFVMSGEPSRIMLEDGIHFTEMGYELLGEQVADALQVFLD